MFGWLKDRFKEGAYRSSLQEIAARFYGDVGSMALINAGAAMSVVQFANRLKSAGVIDFETLRDHDLSRLEVLTTNEWSILESQFLESAASVRDRSVHSDYIFRVAAGYCSCNKRQSYESNAALVIMDAVRTGADACITLGVSPNDDMTVALPKALNFFLKM